MKAYKICYVDLSYVFKATYLPTKELTISEETGRAAHKVSTCPLKANLLFGQTTLIKSGHIMNLHIITHVVNYIHVNSGCICCFTGF